MLGSPPAAKASRLPWIATAAALLMRRGDLQGGSRLESMVSREASFLLNNWAFIVILVVIFVGTLFPVFSELFGDRQIVWGPSFYNQLLGPFGVFLLLLTGGGPRIAWRRASPSQRRVVPLPRPRCRRRAPAGVRRNGTALRAGPGR